ncbi:translin [Arctopsyche grandis]|uniref:translin n=1 Tax=Arctopsyche grandis TaxID=121162 RepID=UPI00406D9657
MSKFSSLFLDFQKHLDKEQGVVDGIKAIVSDLDSTARQIVITLQVIHQGDHKKIEACSSARVQFEDVRKKFVTLAGSFPLCDFYRYHDIWKYSTQRLCYCAALIVWLEVGILISRETAASILGIADKESDGVFHLDIEDFLMGLLELSSELARYAVNSVTHGDYSTPMQISHFISDLSAGFRLLNLKNDALRRRFDVLKYDVKKIEEVVYDLSVRNLIPKPQSD